MPGGDADYLKKGEFVFDQVKKMNDAGQLYPLWGTCLGYENLVIWTANMRDKALETYGINNVSLPLNFKKDPQGTKMFSSFEKYG